VSVTLVFACCGCPAKAKGVGPLRKEFVSVSGRSCGFGSARWMNTPDDLAPEGWIAADPYTHVTYCPKCWAEINAEASL